jgi:hypothetical protein
MIAMAIKIAFIFPILIERFYLTSLQGTQIPALRAGGMSKNSPERHLPKGAAGYLIDAGADALREAHLFNDPIAASG